MQIQTNAQILIHADIEDVFNASIDCQNLPQFFSGYQDIPGIKSAKTLDGLPLHPGSHRIVTNSDGSIIEEVIVTLERPHIQEYRLIGGFKPPFSWLVSGASGKWQYKTLDKNTQVTWEFVFETPHILAYSIFYIVVKQSFQTAQTICLEKLKAYVEENCR